MKISDIYIFLSFAINNSGLIIVKKYYNSLDIFFSLIYYILLYTDIILCLFNCFFNN